VHILFLTDNFPPEVNAPATRTFEHCCQWAKEGHQVTVITGVPNFPKGKVFPGYRNRLHQVEWLEGIRVVRVWTYITANKGVIRRTLDYLSFLPAAVLASLTVKGADVVIGTSPQFFTVCAAYIVSRLKRIPFLFELRDIWPDSIVAVGAIRPSWVIRTLERLELFLYRKAAVVVALTWAFRENLISRGVPRSKISVIPNGVDLSFFSPGKRPRRLEEALGVKGKSVISYIGTVGMAHAVDKLVEVAMRMQDDQRAFFLIIGDGAEWGRVRDLARVNCLSNIRVMPLVSKHEVVSYYALTDLFIVTLRDTGLFRTVIPSKIFEAMAMELPIVCAVDGQCRSIIEQAQAGICVQPEDVDGMVKAIKTLLDSPALARQMGRNGRSFVSQYFDRRVLAQQMLAVLEEVVNRNGQSVGLDQAICSMPWSPSPDHAVEDELPKVLRH